MGFEHLLISGSRLLTILIFLPLVSSVLLFFIPAAKTDYARKLGLVATFAAFIVSMLVLKRFDPNSNQLQLGEQAAWIPSFGIRYMIGIDGLSIWLVLLTTLLSFLVMIASPSITKNVRAYIGCLLLLETGMLGTFLALDGITFYVFWELMLVPMYFLIGIWGGARRVYAAVKFVLYTALGSLLMLVAIVYLGYQHYAQFGSFSFFLGDWTRLTLAYPEEMMLYAAFALAFAIKIPLFPLHTWLPDAHVEAPTGGSVILAGVLLKMGLYGLLRWGVPVFPAATFAFAPVFSWLGVCGIVFGALVAWVQTDVKKLVAYSSVSHLGFCVIGFSSLNLIGVQGSILQMLNHGISTAALFFLVGVLYDRKHTRQIVDYTGLAQRVPLFSLVFVIFTLSSVGLPLTNGFVGEFLILLGAFQSSPVIGGIAVSGVVLGAMYMLSLYRRMIFGPFDEKNNDLVDLLPREKLIFLPLLAGVFIVGLYPGPILRSIEPTSKDYVTVMQGGGPTEAGRARLGDNLSLIAESPGLVDESHADSPADGVVAGSAGEK